MLRNRLVISISLTILFLGIAILVWANQTHRITIWGASDCDCGGKCNTHYCQTGYICKNNGVTVDEYVGMWGWCTPIATPTPTTTITTSAPTPTSSTTISPTPTASTTTSTPTATTTDPIYTTATTNSNNNLNTNTNSNNQSTSVTNLVSTGQSLWFNILIALIISFIVSFFIMRKKEQ